MQSRHPEHPNLAWLDKIAEEQAAAHGLTREQWEQMKQDYFVYEEVYPST